MKRNHFIRDISVGAIVIPSFLGLNRSSTDPSLDKELVAAFVGAAHKDKDAVMSMLEEHPTLLNSAHDWGGGDFETGLGAASHVGYKELVSLLIDKGAQTNIFTACLFGHLDIVKLMLEAFPTTIHAKGPHGFTLLHHAIKGGNEALGVKAYLEALGATETKIPLY
jgi:ankyrin repeat protein